MESVEQALQMAQATTVIAAAVSTGIILAAIVVQTKYLAAKLDKIQETVDIISQEQHTQNIIFYMDKLTDYVGHVEAARTLLRDRSLTDDIHELAIPLMSTLAGKRNHVLSFLDNILGLAKSSEITPKHLELIVNFVQMVLEVMPLGIHVEYLLCCRIGKIRLAEQILIDGAERFNAALEGFRSFMNELRREVVRGHSGDRSAVYKRIEGNAGQFFQSEQYKFLLSLPTGRIAPVDNLQIAARFEKEVTQSLPLG